MSTKRSAGTVRGCGHCYGRFSKTQRNPPQLEEDIRRLLSKGALVYAVQDDVADRGLERADLIEGIQGVSRGELPKLFAGYEQIWRW